MTKPVTFGGMTLFTTFAPNPDICTYGGYGYLYALYYETGTAYKESIIGTDSNITNGDGKEKVKSKISLGPIIPSSVGLHIGTHEILNGVGGGIGGMDVSCGGVANASEAKVTAFIQGGSGEITQQEVGMAINTNSRVVTWKEK